ncbi:large protein with signal peptide cysteine- - mucin [Cystoisospora suis]|uniref:Large protein with signal peptide cysteine--mucin n=1 Tax=Cystoisospora suis TaxID=483139 RepID=A0A2C6KH07_9APIC|nr:large protein with signal peptide cysteine- - mucin [Cystoisospora suis]
MFLRTVRRAKMRSYRSAARCVVGPDTCNWRSSPPLDGGSSRHRLVGLVGLLHVLAYILCAQRFRNPLEANTTPLNVTSASASTAATASGVLKENTGLQLADDGISRNLVVVRDSERINWGQQQAEAQRSAQELAAVYEKDISILGRVGQNSEINGQYNFINSTQTGHPEYRKSGPATPGTPDLYLFWVASTGPQSPAFWAIGEVPGANEKVRAFIPSEAETPDEATGEWFVFEQSLSGVLFKPDSFIVATRVTCSNGARDGLETGVDCGGPCIPCETYRSCRLPKMLPPGYALGSCPPDGLLFHGQACSYKCPLGWKENGGLGRVCYDGTILEIRRGDGCEQAFERPEENCRFLLLDGAAEEQSQCNGLFISHVVTGMSGQRATFWQKDIGGPLIHLYWEEGYWICGSFETDEEYGYVPDLRPERLISARSVPLTEQTGVWSTSKGTRDRPVSLHCVDPLRSTPAAEACPSFYFEGWSLSQLNGYWHELLPPSSDGRPRFISEMNLIMHWTPLGYWVAGLPEDDTAALALSFSPSRYPPPNGWRSWSSEKGVWQGEENVRSQCVPFDDRVGAGTESTRNSHYGFPATLVGASDPHLLGVAGLLEGLLSFEEGAERIQNKESLGLPPQQTCPHLRLQGGSGLGERCNGVWSRPARAPVPANLPENDTYLVKLSIDSRVMYLYRAEDQWRCTADGVTMLGFSDAGILPANNTENADALAAESGGGNWLDGRRYIQGPWSLSCIPEDEAQKCDQVRVSGFADAAATFNGLWSSSGQVGGRPHFTKKAQAGGIHPTEELHLFYHPLRLWVIGASVASTGFRDMFPRFFTYSLISHSRAPPSGLWTIFERKQNRAVLNLVDVECIRHVSSRVVT